MKVTYPVIFTEADTNILIEVPDLEILTEANEDGRPKGTMADAINGKIKCNAVIKDADMLLTLCEIYHMMIMMQTNYKRDWRERKWHFYR